MLAALPLVGTPVCADRAFCPTRAEFEAAIYRYEWQLGWDLNAAANPPGASDIALVTVHHARKITAIRCSAPEGEPPTIQCSAVFHYSDRQTKRALRLSKDKDRWMAEPSQGAE